MRGVTRVSATHLGSRMLLVAPPKMAMPIAAKEYDTHEYRIMIFNSIAATVDIVSRSLRSCGITVSTLEAEVRRDKNQCKAKQPEEGRGTLNT